MKPIGSGWQNSKEPILSPEAIDYYWDNAPEFVEDNILAPARRLMPDVRMTPDQKDALHAISTSDSVAIESGHGTGKSAVFAWAGIWFLSTRRNSLQQKVRLPCIAPTYHQLHDVLWPEFKRWIPISRVAPLLDYNAGSIWVRGLQNLCFGVARSVKKSAYLQGFHAPHLLWICDEAFGITDESIWETIQGSLTDTSGDNRIFMGGQHTVLVGFVHDAFHRDAEFWTRLRFSTETSPLGSKKYVERIERKYGRASDVFRVRVLGIEPKGNPDSYIQLEETAAARARDVTPGSADAIRVGVDPARFGDDSSVVTVAVGKKVLPQVVDGKTDTYRLYEMTIQALRAARKEYDNWRRADVKIDNSGGWGSGLIDMLQRNTEDNVRVIPVNFDTEGNSEFHDRVSTMFGELKSQLPGLSLPDDDFLEEEIVNRGYNLDKDGRIKMEPKADFKKDHGNSPDRGDSLLLCIAEKALDRYVFACAGSIPTKDYTIRWEKQSESCRHYGALHLSADLRVYFLAAIWEATNGTLYLYDHKEWDMLEPDPITQQLLTRLQMRKFKLNKLMGNDEWFHATPGHRTAAMTLRDAFSKRQISRNIVPAAQYDEAGSIAYGNDLFRTERIVVHKNLHEVGVQLSNWTIDNGKPAAEQSGYCRALLLLLAEVKRQAAEVIRMPKRIDYNTKGPVVAQYHNPWAD